MGCSSTHTMPDLCLLRQIDDNLVIPHQHSLYNSIERAKEIIKAINRLSSKLMLNYYTIIDLTGACVFTNPSIAHCLRCLLYKISAESNGKIELANIQHSEDPPYMTLNTSQLSPDTSMRLSSFLDFIIQIQSYKIINKQIDKDIPELLYLLYEEHSGLVSIKNKKIIKKAIDSFQTLVKVRSILLKKYKIELYLFFTRNDYYAAVINKFGEEAVLNNIEDIYKIAMLNNKLSKTEQDIHNEPMYSNIDQAKKAIKLLVKGNTIEQFSSKNKP